MDFINITQRIVASSPVEFGTIFNSSVELFKKVWLQGFLTILLTLLAILPFYLIIYAPMIVMGITDPETFRHNQMPPVFTLFLIIVMPIFMLAIMTVSLCLNAAFLRMCHKYDLGEMGKDDYFFYFKKEYLKKAFVVALLMLGLSLLGMLACGLGLIYLVVPMYLFPTFFAFDKELSPMEIVKSSFALGNKNWLIIFLLIVVTGIVAELGIVLCFVGVFFTAMFSKIPAYFMYKDTIGLSMDV